MAALALIVVCSIHIQQIVWASQAPLVMHMHDCSSGVAYVWYYPYPAVKKLHAFCLFIFSNSIWQ